MKIKTLLIAIFCMHPLIQAFLGDFVYAQDIFVQNYERSNGQAVQGYSRHVEDHVNNNWMNAPTREQPSFNNSGSQPHSNSWGTDFQSEHR